MIWKDHRNDRHCAGRAPRTAGLFFDSYFSGFFFRLMPEFPPAAPALPKLPKSPTGIDGLDEIT